VTNRLRSNGTAPGGSRAVAGTRNRTGRTVTASDRGQTICRNYSLDNESGAMADRSPQKHDTNKVGKSLQNKRVAKQAREAVKGSLL
jgi:hypothetical protein